MTPSIPHATAQTQDQDETQQLQLQRAALETSKSVMLRQRRMELQLQQAKSDLEQLSRHQAQSLSLLNATLEASPDGVAAFDMAGELVAFNSKYAQIWQIEPDRLARQASEQIRRHCASMVRTPGLFESPLPRQRSNGACDEVAFVDGRVFERHVSPQVMAGQQTGVVVHWHEITLRKLADAQNNRMAQILERSLNEIYLFDQVSLHYVYANLGALNNLGYALAGLRDMTILDVLPEYDRASLLALLHPLVAGDTELLIFETVHRRADRSLYSVQVHLQLDNENGQPLFMALVLDITERKRAERVIWNQANYDALTQLPNRSMLQDRLAQEMAKAQRNDHKLALMFIDLDKFKEVNDTLGHDKGDELLVAAAQRIGGCVRATDTVARMGGDEFVVLLSEVHDGRVASGLAQYLLDALSAPFDLDGTHAVVSGSIGITLFPDDASDGEGLLKNADQAMYVSKARGRNQYSYFTRELEVSAQRRMLLIGQLRQALKFGQFMLYFQPIVDVKTRRICRAEALIRWQHSELGMVPPSEFIPLAEETGLIVDIGAWVFEEAVRWTKRWRDTCLPDFQISINKSPAQFVRNVGDAEAWALHLTEIGLPGNSVIMEITEGLLVDPNSNVSQTLMACRDAGILVAIDDFGTGYSSLSYLKRFDIDYLKIDSSFIRNLAVGSSDLALSEAIIVMAQALGLKVVAEGVETETQLALLAKAGCHFAQGYLFAAPVPPAEFEAMLMRQA